MKAFVLRHGLRYRGRAGWTIPYRRWLAGLTMPEAAPQIALQEYLATVDEAEQRVTRLTEQLRQLVPAWRWAPVVDALQALRGVSFITATGLVAEIGDLRRFTRARELMAYLGLVPFGTLEWAGDAPRPHHQGRQSARATAARRSGLGVSGNSADRPRDATAPGPAFPRRCARSRGRRNSAFADGFDAYRAR